MASTLHRHMAFPACGRGRLLGLTSASMSRRMLLRVAAGILRSAGRAVCT